MDKTYDEWLTEMLIKHGVDRPHEWENHGKYLSDEAISLRHWRTIGNPITWHYTQEAVEYLKQTQYNGGPVNENRSGEDE